MIQPINRTRAHSLKTQLNDRTLWYDGDSSFNSDNLVQASSVYSTLQFVDSINDAVIQYNNSVRKSEAIKVKDECNQLYLDWVLPSDYKNLDVVEYLFEQHVTLTTNMGDDEITLRDIRLIDEIVKYRQRDLFDVLRAVIWIISTLTSNNVVWGVGRGSSVSSYVLYLIGVHDVDPHLYELDIDDFLHN